MLDSEMECYSNKTKKPLSKQELIDSLEEAKQKIDELLRMTVEEHIQLSKPLPYPLKPK